MRSFLAEAQVCLEREDFYGALKRLGWVVEGGSARDLDRAQRVMDIATTIFKEAPDDEIHYDVECFIERLTAEREGIPPPKHYPYKNRDKRRAIPRNYRKALVTVSPCIVMGGHGLPIRLDERSDLVFTAETLTLYNCLGGRIAIPNDDITAIEIAGPGETQSGGGFIGGGFGTAAAAEGMLVASFLNALTSRRKIDTVICIQTLSTETFFHYARARPAALRVQLSPVFTMLRQRRDAAPVAEHTREDPVEQLVSLADMLDRHLITEEEFQRLKTNLLG